jgi:phosphatidate cytidylyltransferase
MTDNTWRPERRDDPDVHDEWADLEPTDGSRPAAKREAGSAPLRFGPDATGPLPHWTAPPTGEVPRITVGKDPTDDLDIWSSFSQQVPVWRDDPDAATGPLPLQQLPGVTPLPSPAEDAVANESTIDREPLFPGAARTTGSVPADQPTEALPSPTGPRTREPIQIGTDPTSPSGSLPRQGSSGDRPRRASGRPEERPSERAGGPGKGRRPVSQNPPGIPASRPPSAGGRPAAPKSGVGGRNMPAAILAGVVIAAIFVLLLRIRAEAVLGLIVAVLGLGAVEFYDKATERGYRPASVVGISACAIMPLAAYWRGTLGIMVVMVMAFAATAVTAISNDSVQSGPLPNTAITLLGIVWIGVLGSHAALILQRGNHVAGLKHVGTDTLLYMAIAVVATDVGALIIGSFAGRTPLRGWISPNKTVEGLIGGIVFTVLALILVHVVNSKTQTWKGMTALIVFAVVIAIVAPIGDLTESMFKRNLDIKDFGTLLPGHGGILDRFDGFLFALPAAYYMLEIVKPYLHK